MEHRYSVRNPASINVLIYKSEIPVAFGRVINGSKIGFFIETNFTEVNVDQVLDVELIPANNEENLCRYICNVQVIRKTTQGLGVEIEFTKAKPIYNHPYCQVANY